MKYVLELHISEPPAGSPHGYSVAIGKQGSQVRNGMVLKPEVRGDAHLAAAVLNVVTTWFNWRIPTRIKDQYIRPMLGLEPRKK